MGDGGLRLAGLTKQFADHSKRNAAETGRNHRCAVVASHGREDHEDIDCDGDRELSG